MGYFNLPQQARIVTAVVPQTDAGGLTGQYVSLKNAGMCFVVVNIAQGAANTIALSINKATAVTPANATAITSAVPIWSNLSVAATDILVRQTAAVSYTTDAGVANKLVVFQIDPKVLGVYTDGSPYDYIALIVGASSGSNIVSAEYYLTDYRYEGEPVNSPTAIT